MTPHRIEGSFRLASDPASIGFVAASTAALSAVVNGVNLMLGAVLVGAMILDQLSGMAKAILTTPPGERWYSRRKFLHGGLDKALLIIGVLAAGLMDMAALHLPAWGDMAAEITPATKIALAYAIVGQLGSVFANVSIVKEARLLSAFMMRRMDAAKLGYEPPVRREAYDRAAVQMERSLETVDGIPFHDAAHQRDATKQGEEQ